MHVDWLLVLYQFDLHLHLQLIMGAKLLPVCFVIFLFWGKAFYLLDYYFMKR